MTKLSEEIRLFWTHGRPVERVGYLVGAVLVSAGLVHLGVQAVHGGPWLGPVSWRKPVTFGLSFGLTVISVAWAASFLRIGPRIRTALFAAFLTASLIEVTLISIQAWRRVPSHFNFETPFDAAVAVVLAAGGGVLFIVVGVVFGFSLREQPQLEPTLRLALRLGFGALVVALVAGAVMIGIGVALVRAGDPQAAYHTAGMFKPAHAVAMHGVAVLPGLAWLARRTDLPVGRRTLLWRVATAGYLGLLVGSFALGSPGTLAWLIVVVSAATLAGGAVPVVLAALRDRDPSIG